MLMLLVVGDLELGPRPFRLAACHAQQKQGDVPLVEELVRQHYQTKSHKADKNTAFSFDGQLGW